MPVPGPYMLDGAPAPRPAGCSATAELLAIVSAGWSAPDVTLDDAVVGNGAVAIRWTVSAPHPRVTPLFAQTAARPALPAVAVGRVAGGRVVEYWLSPDAPGLWERLRALLTPASVSA